MFFPQTFVTIYLALQYFIFVTKLFDWIMLIKFLMRQFVSFDVLVISFLLIIHFDFVNMKSLMFIVH